MSEKSIFSVGRRKNAIARVKLIPNGSGQIKINERAPVDYLKVDRFVSHALDGLELTQTRQSYDLNIHVNGGGLSGQSGAIRLGIARALQKHNENLRPDLKKAGLLRRDSRMVERKKYGLHKARKGTQFSKR
ncbi:MAG: 30S ribosomal protein S9 [Leptospiraceae bacterium]|nr:30S ribosomal protein S9 [Leptospiraceae bacterium]